MIILMAACSMDAVSEYDKLCLQNMGCKTGFNHVVPGFAQHLLVGGFLARRCALYKQKAVTELASCASFQVPGGVSSIRRNFFVPFLYRCSGNSAFLAALAYWRINNLHVLNTP